MTQHIAALSNVVVTGRILTTRAIKVSKIKMASNMNMKGFSLTYLNDAATGNSSPGNSSPTSLEGGGTEAYTFCDKARETACLLGFKDLYEAKELFDVTLSVQGMEFGAHRALLAASSDYFRAMFTTNYVEKNQSVVKINGVEASAMEQILKYLYSGEAKLHTYTVQHILSAANLFQLGDLKDGCAIYMAKKLDIDNCIGIHFFAQAHECETLEFKAWDLISDHFVSVASCMEYLELSMSNLIDVIKYDDLQATEEDVFEVTLKWLMHNVEERSSCIYEVFSHIRFALLEEHFFFDKVKSNLMLLSEPFLLFKFEAVVRFKLMRSRWMEIDLRFEPRFGASFCRVVVYTSYLDDEKRQVLQLYGQRSDEATNPGNILCDLPIDMENPNLLVTGENTLYIAGGDGGGQNMCRWIPEDNNFEDVSCMDTHRKQFCLVQVDRAIFALGGCNQDGNLSSVGRYLETEDDWETVSPMPKELRCHCATSFQGKLYVFGGELEKVNKKVTRGKKELSKHAYCYDPREDKWTALLDMKTPRALSGCTVFRNKIYVIGGFGSITDSWIKDKSPENCLSSVETYDPQTNTWEQGPDLPVPLCAMGVVKYYGTIYILGGENEEEVSSTVYFLNEDNQWEQKDEMVAGVTETSIHSAYSVINIHIDRD